MDGPQRCPQCGNSLPPDAPHGVCPRCVLGLGLPGESAADATGPAGSRFDLPGSDDLARLFPNLEIIGLVGQGGMGAVYKARQPGLDRMVALKILPPEVGRDPTFAERFAREARALARLSHNNIVSVYDSGQTGGLYYFVMEFIDGVNLRQALLAGQMTPEKALAIVPQICDALQYAHEEGIIHRDIKPENVLLDKKGRIKVADFGLAKLVGHMPADISLTGTSQAMGTMHYMAPEQMEQPQTVDHRADIYSLGVVFYELLTGRLPLGRFALPSERVQIDIRLDEVVLKTLEREPQHRYQRVSEVKTDMDAISRHAAAVPTAPLLGRGERNRPHAAREPVTVAPGGDTRPTNSNPVLVIILVAIPLAVIVLTCLIGPVAVYFFSQGSPTWIMLGIGAVVFVVAAACVVGVVVSLAQRPAAAREVASERPAVPPERFLAAQRAVRWPALAMLFVAFLNCLPVVILFADDYTSLGDLPMFHRVVTSVLSTVISTVVILGAFSMRDLRFRTLAMVATILLLVPCHFAFLPGIVVGIWSLSVLARADVREGFLVRKGRAPLATSGKADAPVMPSAGMPILLAALCAVIPCVLATYFIAYSISRSPRAAPYSTTASHFGVGEQFAGDKTTTRVEDREAVIWGAAGPKMGPRIRYLGVREAQIAQLDLALADIYKEYEAVEQKHVSRKWNELGHTVITIAPFPKELSELEDRFWTVADGIVTDKDAQGLLRNALTFPGNIFRYGQAQNTVELWKSGSWYYHQVGGSRYSLGPELPHQYRGLWQPEPEETKTDSKPPADH